MELYRTALAVIFQAKINLLNEQLQSIKWVGVNHL